MILLKMRWRLSRFRQIFRYDGFMAVLKAVFTRIFSILMYLCLNTMYEVCKLRCGNKTRTQQEVCNLFNANYPDNLLTQSTVSKIESKFRETGDVKDLPKSGRPKITQDKNIDTVLSMGENPQSTYTLVASENEVSQTTVLRILRKENYHPYKFQLVQELNEHDPDRRLQFCEIMMNLCQTN
ncbi:hypothetical protein NQ318_000794 [Aromia moschata]|uniref:DUF4817 domain-containing protein n=1 Tax=Aromia moschata TaxID=1265417 RepID=A0AAV8YV73_9CUCU|nr:hypothetical protein NQ318_000794 [Aromia moschata]